MLALRTLYLKSSKAIIQNKSVSELLSITTLKSEEGETNRFVNSQVYRVPILKLHQR